MRIYTEGLLSKWGFRDGDVLDDFLRDAQEDGRLPAGRLNEHGILRALVRRFIEPVLEQTVELVDIETIHNPIRAESVDGVKCDWYDYERNPSLTPEFVDVPDETILNIAVGFIAALGTPEGTEGETTDG